MNILIIGAGAVGRGLIAPLFAGPGNRIMFYDTNRRLATRLNDRRRYPLTTGNLDEWTWVRVAEARYKADEVITPIAKADVIFVAVRVENVAAVAEVLDRGLAKTRDMDKPIVVCENAPNAAGELEAHVDVGWRFVSAIAECILPEPTAEMTRRDPLLAYHDPSGHLVVDARAWSSTRIMRPSVPGLVFEDNFALAWDLKWYCHCALHALVAYLGLEAGCIYIHDAVGDQDIARRVRAVMQKAEERLDERYSDAAARIHGRIAHEFEALADATRPDPCARVGRDATRKVRKGERLDALLQLVGGRNATIEKAMKIARGMADPHPSPHQGGDPTKVATSVVGRLPAKERE